MSTTPPRAQVPETRADAAEPVVEHAHAWSPGTARARFREGLAGPTAGIAAGHTHANLISVPADWAYDMLLHVAAGGGHGSRPPPAPTYAPGQRFLTDARDEQSRVALTGPTPLPPRHTHQNPETLDT